MNVDLGMDIIIGATYSRRGWVGITVGIGVNGTHTGYNVISCSECENKYFETEHEAMDWAKRNSALDYLSSF